MKTKVFSILTASLLTTSYLFEANAHNGNARLHASVQNASLVNAHIGDIRNIAANLGIHLSPNFTIRAYPERHFQNDVREAEDNYFGDIDHWSGGYTEHGPRIGWLTRAAKNAKWLWFRSNIGEERIYFMIPDVSLFRDVSEVYVYTEPVRGLEEKLRRAARGHIAPLAEMLDADENNFNEILQRLIDNDNTYVVDIILRIVNNPDLQNEYDRLFNCLDDALYTAVGNGNASIIERIQQSLWEDDYANYRLGRYIELDAGLRGYRDMWRNRGNDQAIAAYAQDGRLDELRTLTRSANIDDLIAPLERLAGNGNEEAIDILLRGVKRGNDFARKALDRLVANGACDRMDALSARAYGGDGDAIEILASIACEDGVDSARAAEILVQLAQRSLYGGLDAQRRRIFEILTIYRHDNHDIGPDSHYNGHRLFERHPNIAAALVKCAERGQVIARQWLHNQAGAREITVNELINQIMAAYQHNLAQPAV